MLWPLQFGQGRSGLAAVAVAMLEAFSLRLVFPHHLVGAGITARPLPAASPSPSSAPGRLGSVAAAPESIPKSGMFPFSTGRSLCPSHVSLSRSPSSQAQEARHAAALRHRVPRVRLRAGHQGDQRAHRLWRLPKVRATASLPAGDLVPGCWG